LHKLNKQWQLGIGVVASTPEFQNDDNVESSISAEAMYFINDSWSVVAQAEIGNIKTSTLGVRYSF
jgi:hypothetical protein